MANATLSKDEILEAIGNMSVFELADLIEAFKSRFNVTIAAAPVGGAAPAAGGAGGAAAPAAEEQTEFTVTLKEAANCRICSTGFDHGSRGRDDLAKAFASSKPLILLRARGRRKVRAPAARARVRAHPPAPWLERVHG